MFNYINSIKLRINIFTKLIYFLNDFTVKVSRLNDSGIGT